MHPERTEEALRRVIEYCLKILRFEGRPSDDDIETCKKILNIIRETQNRK